ncbi:4-hydroxy-3-methylbut-2-enyl diphosphate reductase [Thermomicrobiaceae bacterium CFH 74404]|uniref:4-hydroxy-3-methylbut-2-enyl diphosphate reductase n=1 Tax=Thermalbibacter longus TaxID=2951981 RepID=A0AA41WCN8_9BACT|nr:4-hydroxy-3-methylbut-2-enyl diphosphate reductase [Thermalbibacter longus]MCM8748059.1 4-hydroxy-3-methylbut-2-enyl diphosphate reductase [Thermalbibacter longus]
MEKASGRRRIVLAEVMGFCWGVRRALDIVRQASREGGSIAALGDIIHNPHVVQELRNDGIEPVESIADAHAAKFHRVAITAHGAGPSKRAQAESLGLEVIDTTCPLVMKVQRLATRLVREGYFLVIFGDCNHPEVRGVLEWADTSRAVVAKRSSDLPWTAPRGNGQGPCPPRKVALISQTTKQTEPFLSFAQELASLILPHGGELRVVNTICQPTWERQEALRELARQVDLVLVIGGRKSSNTARLVEVGRACNVPSYQIEGPAELRSDWFEGVQTVGLSAGASTPDVVILETIQALVERGFDPPARLWRLDDPDVDDFAE